MAISGRQTNTMIEHLQKMLRLITDAKATPDTDLEFLVNLETMILQKVRGPLDQAGVDTSMMTPPNVIPMAQGAGAVPQGAAPGPPTGVPGLQTSTMPNPDELRRLLAAGQ